MTIPIEAATKMLAEARWYAEALKLIASAGHEVEYDPDIAHHRVDGALVNGGQICEMAFALGKEPLTDFE